MAADMHLPRFVVHMTAIPLALRLCRHTSRWLYMTVLHDHAAKRLQGIASGKRQVSGECFAPGALEKACLQGARRRRQLAALLVGVVRRQVLRPHPVAATHTCMKYPLGAGSKGLGPGYLLCQCLCAVLCPV